MGLTIAAQGPNVMVKLPGSKEGYEILEELTARGISTNNTTSFTVAQYVRCMRRGERRAATRQGGGRGPVALALVITHMSARLGELGDWRTEAKARGIELSPPRNPRRRGGGAQARLLTTARSIGHPSKMLQCSMRVEKDERTGKTVSRHIQDFAGSDMVYTCPPSYIAGLMQVEDELEPFDAQGDRPRAEQGQPRKAAQAAELPPGLRVRRHDARTSSPSSAASRPPTPSSPRRPGRRSTSCG